LMPGTGLATPPLRLAFFLLSPYAMCLAHWVLPSTLGSGQRHVQPPVARSFPAVTRHRRCSLSGLQKMPQLDLFLPLDLVTGLIGVFGFLPDPFATMPMGTAAVGVPGWLSTDAAMAGDPVPSRT